MFSNITSPLLVSAARGALVTLGVAILAFGGLYGAGADKRAIVAGVIATAIPVMLGFLGWGKYDANRAAAAAAGDASAVHASDVQSPTPVAPVAESSSFKRLDALEAHPNNTPPPIL